MVIEKSKVLESWRILKILIYKNVLVRKRHRIWMLLEFIPLFLVCFVTLVALAAKKPPEKIHTDSHYRMQSSKELIAILQYGKYIFYAPKNNFTENLMDDVRECYFYRAIIWGFANESEMLAFYYQDDLPNSILVIFNKPIDESIKHLRYTIRYRESLESLYNSKSYPTNLKLHYTYEYPFAQMQICLDSSFINLKNTRKPKVIPDMYVQQMPYPAHTKHVPIEPAFRGLFSNTLPFITYFYFLIYETMITSDEKFVGTNVLMSMNGISNTLNLFGWLITGLMLLVPFFALPVLMLLKLAGYLYYGNSLILFFIITFYLSHLLTFGIHLTAYFSRMESLQTGFLIITLPVVFLRHYIFTDSTLFLTPYLGILFPYILFDLALNEVESYEVIAEGIQWSNLFVNENPIVKFGGSIGMILILSIIGTILHFYLAIYVYAINPGKYGAAKDPLFFLKKNSKTSDDDDLENLEYDGMDGEFIESLPTGIYVPGIRMRNLKKTYNPVKKPVGLFSSKFVQKIYNALKKPKVDALRGVSVDFYKGQITSLLGHNGAGKTTMISILTGVTSLTDGTVLINSKNLKNNASEIMKEMGSCPQQNLYFSSLTVFQQLWFFAMVKSEDKSKSQVREDVQTLLQKLKLFEKRDAMPDTLSGGQKRRLCVAIAIVGNCSVIILLLFNVVASNFIFFNIDNFYVQILILDEPTTGLDPESRRVIWDILLKMKGQKTILLSTHNMEEADILGDRIAILHEGRLKSCGSPLFLKKLMGQNNIEVTLSIKPHSNPENIRSELHKNGIIVYREIDKIIIRIPNSPSLPDSLDKLESKKKELGVTGFSVSLISLEQVFLKMTRANDEPQELVNGEGNDDSRSQPDVNGDDMKLTGKALYTQRVKALLLKKFACTSKDRSLLNSKFLSMIISVMMCVNILTIINHVTLNQTDPRPIELGMYPDAHALHTSYEKSIGDQYQAICQTQNGKSTKVTDKNLESALLDNAKKNLAAYDNHLIAAAEFNSSAINAFFSERATFSLPISINLLWNAIARSHLGSEYSISLYVQDLPEWLYQDVTTIGGYIMAWFIVDGYRAMLSYYLTHPYRESKKGLKQLQIMTGISGFRYWGTTFLFDFVEYFCFSILFIISFVTADTLLRQRMFGLIEISIEMTLLVLFSINALPITYIFSFIKKKRQHVEMLLINIPCFLLVVDLMMASLSDVFETFRQYQRGIFLLLPFVSFLHSQISFFITVFTNARCHTLPNEFYDSWCYYREKDVCCDFHCYDGKCEKSKPFFKDAGEDISLTDSLIYLCITPVLYFGILVLLERRVFQKLKIKCSNMEFHNDEDSNADRQVQLEKLTVFQQIYHLTNDGESFSNNRRISNERYQHTANSSYNTNNRLFLVYELQKSYKNVDAVKDVSFGVKRSECFGLLGVNGAGKTTTFKIMTGGVLADHGIMYIGDKDFANNETYFLSQIGYCPQDDATLNYLNTYDHLRLFARLRGIPESQVENEVEAWIKKLNLTACASRPSGTYSGGNKRRLNLAIALIGNSNFIFMDEPTSGIDPRARRAVWNIIKSCQRAGRTVVLTSHSMEECEVLCNRLTIMVDGKLVCIGATEELKQRFGAGYDIQVRLNPEKARDQVDGIKNDLPQLLNCVLTDENLGYLMYHVAAAGVTWRKMYDAMNKIKGKYDCIDDFFVSSSSLEQLFLLFAKTASRSEF